MKKRSVLLKLFFSTLYLSAFTFGGGYVIVTLMKKQFVDKYHWIEESEMLDLIAIAQSAPGVAAFNFVDTLAQVGTTVAQVDEILNAEEQVHSETPVTFFRPYRRAQRRPLRLPCGSGDPPRRQPDHTAKQNDGAGRPVRRRKIDHCQARRGLLGRRLRQHHHGRPRAEGHPADAAV